MHRRSEARRVVLALVAGILVVGCDAVSEVAPPPDGPIDEHLPRFASLDLRGEPPVADRALRLQLDVLPDSPALRSIDIPSGTVIRWSEGLSAGPIRLVSTAPDCSWELALPPEASTSVVFHHQADPCWFEIADPVDDGDAGHLAATVTVQPWDGLLVEAISLDTPAQPVPAAVPPDEGGLAQLGPLWPGRYDIVLRRGDVILERRTIEVRPTGPQDSTISLTLDGVQD